MAILLLLPDTKAEQLAGLLNKKLPGEDIRIWPETGRPEEIDVAVVWAHPHGALKNLPNLKLILSYGAGVDHIFNDPDLPVDVPICRFFADSLSRQMADYVSGVILNHRLRLIDYREHQAAGNWHPWMPRRGNKVTILGLGQLGQATARQLNTLRFDVTGWSRTAKTLDYCHTCHGQDMLTEAVCEADYVVCLLPLTEETRGILNGTLFSAMKKGAYLINVGRGDHLNENDLLDALYQGHLGGACLDVFSEEPLPSVSPLWRHPRILITPHIASVTDPEDLADYVVQSFNALKQGSSLKHLVDRQVQY
ncbi:2-hydroxyacid dehydrogenase [Luteithermobacter gelatinilyticus]|uniref:2-hydroxyacid dehydrogenase n=1 Tax=Luteithermobacter gelatinilyticus TaxID=2582913 RepID=UPI00110590B3|nr:glyoxylate/hydroxypyruvate reductase A [Luteithermobacter gelatinilyticus]